MATLTATPQGPDACGHTPLMYAITTKEIGRVKALVGRVDLNEADRDGKTALHHAALSGQALMIKTLLKAKADANIRDKDGATPLIYAAMCGYEDVVRTLLSHRADPRCTDRHGRTAAEAARRSGFTRIAQILR